MTCWRKLCFGMGDTFSCKPEANGVRPKTVNLCAGSAGLRLSIVKLIVPNLDWIGAELSSFRAVLGCSTVMVRQNCPDLAGMGDSLPQFREQSSTAI